MRQPAVCATQCEVALGQKVFAGHLELSHLLLRKNAYPNISMAASRNDERGLLESIMGRRLQDFGSDRVPQSRWSPPRQE